MSGALAGVRICTMGLIVSFGIQDTSIAENEMTQATQRGTTSFRLQSNLIIIDVEVNGQAAEFLLDTGAASTVLTREFADRLGLQEADRGAGAGAGGIVRLSIVRVDAITVAGITDRAIACPVMDITEVRNHVGQNVDGILGFDFFGTGSLHIDYVGRKVTFERPSGSASADNVAISGNVVRLPRFGIEFTLPLEGWNATIDTPLPSIPVILHGPDDTKITVSEMMVHGMSVATMRATLDASVAAQVEGFERVEAHESRRAGQNAYAIRYLGTDNGTRRKYVTEAILFDAGLLVMTCDAPLDSFSRVAPDIEATLASLRRFGSSSRVPD